MKQFKFLAASLLMITVFSLQTHAQNFRSKIAYLSTTDSSIHTICTVPVSPNEAGILTFNVIGYAQDNGAAVTSCYIARYINVSGTITLGTPTAILPTQSDAAITTSNTFFTVSGNNILLGVKAGRPVPVRWQATIQRESRVKNN